MVAVAFGAAVAAGVGALTGWLTAGFVCAGAFVSGAFATACGFVSRFGSITACLRSAWCSLRLARFGFRCRRLLLGIAAMNWRNGGWFSWQRGVHHGSVNLFLILRLHQRVVQIALNLNTLLAFRRSWRPALSRGRRDRRQRYPDRRWCCLRSALRKWCPAQAERHSPGCLHRYQTGRCSSRQTRSAR